MALTDKLRAIGDAIRGKTGKTEEMTLDQMAVEIAGIQAGGGGAESGEFTNTNYYKFTIPVTSRKKGILVYPKVIEDSTHNTGRISYFLVVDGLFVWQRRPIVNNGSYFSTAQTSVFADDKIEINDQLGVPYNVGDYYWFAW